MRHDPIDPAGYLGTECPPEAVTDAVGRELRGVLDLLERESCAAIAAAEAELEALEQREAADLEDNAARSAAMTLASELVVRGRKEIEEIEAARDRFTSRTFGVCERCHVAIPLFRLRALPTTRVCVTCARMATHATEGR